jgi:hypothetical protein
MMKPPLPAGSAQPTRRDIPRLAYKRARSAGPKSNTRFGKRDALGQRIDLVVLFPQGVELLAYSSATGQLRDERVAVSAPAASNN